jgi:hypothetical protein
MQSILITKKQDFYDDNSVNKCYENAPMCDGNRVDLQTSYNPPLQTFGGGKSGAFVFKLTETKVLKYYTDAYKSQIGKEFYIMDNQRPFREYLSMCRMSGTPGFPLVYDVFCAESPNDWISKAGKSIPKTDYGLAVISSIAPGIPLLQIMKKRDRINLDVVYRIALAILTLISAAKEKLGADFEHFDLHPDNVFVDIENEKQYTYSSYGFIGPTVSLIDFDLVSANGINRIFSTKNRMTGMNYEPKEPTEWEEKRGDASGTKTVAERTIKFLQQMVGVGEDLFNILSNATNINNTDIRNWYVTISAMMVYAFKRARQKSEVLKICQDVTDCLDKNFDVFSQFSALRRSVRNNKRKFGLISDVFSDINSGVVLDTKKKINKFLGHVPEFMKELLENKIINQSLIEFQTLVFERRGVFPTYDDTTIRFIFHCNDPWSLDINSKTNLGVDQNANMMGSGFNIDIKTKALGEYSIDIDFSEKFVFKTNAMTHLPSIISDFLMSIPGLASEYVISLIDRASEYIFSDLIPELQPQYPAFNSTINTISAYLETKETIRINKIHAASKNISVATLNRVEDDFRFKHLKVELVGGDTNITATIERPSHIFRTAFGSIKKISSLIKYNKSADNEKRAISVNIPADPTATPLFQKLKKLVDEIKKLPQDKLIALYKKLFLQLSMWIIFEEIREAILLILCSYQNPMLELIYEYEDIDLLTGIKVTKHIRKLIESNIAFPPAGAPLTFVELLNSFERDTSVVFIHNVFNFVRQMCSMSIDERNKFFTKANKDVNSIIKTTKSIMKTQDFKLAKQIINNRQEIANKISNTKKVIRRYNNIASTTRNLLNKGVKPVIKDKFKKSIKKSVKRVKKVLKDEVKDTGKQFAKDTVKQYVVGGPQPRIRIFENKAKKRRS